MPLRVVYKCADGTDFPVDWEDPADAQQFWVSMRDHKPRPNLPIESSHGTDIWRWVREVTAEAGLPLSDFVAARAGEFNGHMYIANLAFVLDPEAALARLRPMPVTEGDLDEAQRARLLEIANKCPVHRTLHSEVWVPTTLA